MTARNVILKEQPTRRNATKPANDGVAAAGPTPGRWICHHRLDGSDIEAYVMGTGGVEMIAQTRAAEGIDARANAERITRAVNAYETTQPLIAELVAALKLCLACEGISDAIKQEAGLIIGRIKKR